MTDTTKLPASFSNGAVFESSTAFLMLQKNKKRQTTMTDDVFRIFRRTGKKINEISNRIEGERNIFLKDSYNNKNTLYKELSGIANIKPGQNDRGRKAAKMKNHITPLPRFSSVHTSDLIYRPVKSQLGRQKLGEESEFEPEKRINVNVLKRCECCRRLAFRYKEMTEKQEAEERKKNEGNADENTSSETQKLTQEVLDSVKLTPNVHVDDGRKRSQLYFYDTRTIPTSQIVPESFSYLRRQSKANQEKSQRRVTISEPPVTAPPSPVKDKKQSRCRSYSVLMNTDKTSRPEPTPTPVSRQKIRVKFENPNAKEKLKLQGMAWSNHLRRLNGYDEKEKQTVVTLSKTYIAFKKLLHQMEEERKKEEAALNDDRSSDSSCRNSPIPRNRLYSTSISLAASLRWQPRRKSERVESFIPGIDDIIESTSNSAKDVNDDEERVNQLRDPDKNLGFFTVLECS